MTNKAFGLIPQNIDLGPFWTIPNFLSVVRLVLALPIAYLIVTGEAFAWMFGLILFAIATDWIDGHLARWFGTVSEWGKVIDPVADKLCAVLLVGALVWRGSLPEWFFGLVIARDLVILIGGIVLSQRIGRIVMSTWLGKITVVAVALTVLAALLQADPVVMRWTVQSSTGLLLLSFLQYMVRFFRLFFGKHPDQLQHAASSSAAAPPHTDHDQHTADPVTPDK